MPSARASADPLMAVVVISYRGRKTLPAAVRSVLDQDVAAEIVVAHSGEGDVERQLAGAGLEVRIVKSAGRLFPGGARNLGIAVTRAPYVAFLADDCLAEPGWLRERLLAHAEGFPAVASALLCHKPNNPLALATHLSLYVRRMPRAAPAVALAYGASYDRNLFERYGLFRDDLESGEDTEFHNRLDAADKPVWRPDVRTVHCGVETLGAFLFSQFRRGARMAQAWRAIGAYDHLAVARNAIERSGLILGETMKVVEPQQRLTAALAMPFIVLGNVLYAAGAWTHGEGR
jgi:glycosyltransferase involved in cell wall biosynthesis